MQAEAKYFMDGMPANGTEVLREIDGRRRPRPRMDTAFAEPRDAVQRSLSEIWSEVLGISGLGVDDSLFALGGESLEIVQIASRIYGRYGIEIPPSEFFDNPTISGLAEAMYRNGLQPPQESNDR
jgi:acyl carrier protein